MAEDPGEWASWKASVGDVRIETMGSWALEGRHRIMMAAHIELGEVPVTSKDGVVLVPDRPRRTTEDAIEVITNAIAVMRRCSRSLSSPPPFVALQPLDEEAERWLLGVRGFGHLMQNHPRVRGFLPVTTDIVTLLAERADGAELLASALSHEDPTGRYHDLLRVFERAFARKANALKDLLNAFVVGSRFGFSKKEIAGWIDVRGKATHADRDRTPPYLTDADLRGLVVRMEEAACDLLLNKTIWRNPDPGRTTRWVPTEGHSSATQFFLTQGVQPPPLEMQLFDPFDVYPADLSASPTSLPAGWWSVNLDPEEAPAP